MDISSPQELHLKDYMNVLRRRRSIVIIFFITTVLTVTAGSFIMRPVYRATAMLLIDIESPDVLTTTGAVSLESQNYFSYKEYYQSQAEILTSQSLVHKVFDEFKLADSQEYKNEKEPLKAFLKTIRVEPVRDTRLLKLNVDNTDAKLAVKIANRIAELYVRRNLYYISRSELVNLLKNEYLKFEAKLSEYNKVYRHKHPEMIRLKKEMAEMTGKIEQMKESPFTFDIVTSDGKDEEKYALDGFKANNVSIQDPAEEPVIPLKPKKKLNIILSVIVGLFGGVGLAFFFEYLDDTIKELEDAERIAKWPFLGNVPKITGNGKMTEIRKDLFVNEKPKDPIAEAYRSIRTSIFFSATEEHPLKSIVVTSPGPQEGKTTTLCNLGIAMAQNQKRVLLVDADMRKPRLHEVFKVEAEKGLSTFLSGQARFDELVRDTGIENLFLVNGGPNPPNPSELLSSNKMKEFMKLAAAKYDFILFDTPPVAILTDAVLLGLASDGVIMVIESGKTSKRAFGRIHKLLDDSRARIIGIILNKISIHSGSYYYYSYYYGKSK